MRELRRECGQLGLDLGSFFDTYDRWKTKILNHFDARQTSAAAEGINNKARVITQRTYGLKSAKSLWDRLILDLNRASQAIGYPPREDFPALVHIIPCAGAGAGGPPRGGARACMGFFGARVILDRAHPPDGQGPEGPI